MTTDTRPSAGEAGAAYPQSSFALPEGATDLLLIRHGQSAPMGVTDYPVTDDGHADPELSELGRAQAEHLAGRLADVGIAAIYVSTLRRTQQTAAPLAARTHLTPVADPDLCEVRLGEWEGGEFRRRAVAGDPLLVQLYAEGEWAVIPGAESNAAFDARVRAALERIRTAHPGQRVAVVCHGGVIGQVIGMATGAKGLTFMHCDNAAITQVVLHGEHWIVRRYNDTEHLGPAFAPVSQPVI